MNPQVSIVMGSTSDLPVVQKAMDVLNMLAVPFEVRALSAHRTPSAVDDYALSLRTRGVKVVVAAAGMAAALPGVIAARTSLPVVGLPIKGMLDGTDALLSMVQMPPGIPVATVGVNQAGNAALLAAQILALSDTALADRVEEYRAQQAEKVVAADKALADIHYEWKTN